MVYVNGVPYVHASVFHAQAVELAARGAPQAPIHIVVNVEAAGTETAGVAVARAEPLGAEILGAGVAGAEAATIEQLRDEWMPMGTFAVLEDPEATETSIVIQLATNRLGHIAGNVFNMETDEVLPLYGAIDPETQRVAMRVEGRDEIVECGLWNLTQDTLTVLLHVDEHTTEERTFVRLSDPEEEELAP